jgi:hypothetical protein
VTRILKKREHFFTIKAILPSYPDENPCKDERINQNEKQMKIARRQQKKAAALSASVLITLLPGGSNFLWKAKKHRQ